MLLVNAMNNAKDASVLWVTAFCFASPSLAEAQYAEPPNYGRPGQQGPTQVAVDGRIFAEEGTSRRAPSSSVRLHAGPLLLLWAHAVRPGGFAALEYGKDAAGVRATGAWAQTGATDGLSQYTAEFWLDLGHGTPWHPIVGAGAGLGRIRVATDGFERATVGVGVVRAALQYMLPVPDTDARASLEMLGCLPVAAPQALGRANPWAIAAGTLGVGF